MLEGELAEVRVRIGRYVQAIGTGVAAAENQAQLATLTAWEQTVLAELAVLTAPPRPVLHRAALRRRLGEWHGLLQQSPQIARQLLRK